MAKEAAARKPAGKGKRPSPALLEARRRQDVGRVKPTISPKKKAQPPRDKKNSSSSEARKRAQVRGQTASAGGTPTARRAAVKKGAPVRIAETSSVKKREAARSRSQKKSIANRMPLASQQVIDLTKRRAAAGERASLEAVATRSGLSATGYGILGVSLLMFLYGMIMIFSASSGAAFRVYGTSYYFLLRQAVWFGVGLIGLVSMAYLDYHRLSEISPIMMAVALAALAAVPLFGSQVYGSTRAVTVGPIVVQPSEFAKMSLLILAVYVFNKRRGKLDEWREIIVPVLLVAALACGLILMEPDLGTMLIAAIAVFMVLFLAGAPLRKLAVLAMAGGGATAIFIFASAYRKARFLAFLHPWEAPREGGFHIIQSMVALGSGSVTGLGLGMSRQKFFYLPNAHTDFIFSIIGEEIGLIGTIAVLVLFAAFLCLGLRAARRAPDGLGKLLATSITCMITIQALVNMGAATGALPITGVTLPFISYGGSSLVICMCLAGILINVSRQEAEAGIPRDGRKKRERGDMRGRDRRASPSPAGPGRKAPVA